MADCAKCGKSAKVSPCPSCNSSLQLTSKPARAAPSPRPSKAGTLTIPIIAASPAGSPRPGTPLPAALLPTSASSGTLDGQAELAKKVLAKPVLSGIIRSEMSFPSGPPGAAAVAVAPAARPRREAAPANPANVGKSMKYVHDAVDCMASSDIVISPAGDAAVPMEPVPESPPEGMSKLRTGVTSLPGGDSTTDESSWAKQDSTTLLKLAEGPGQPAPRVPFLGMAGLGSEEKYRRPRSAQPWNFAATCEILTTISNITFETGTFEPVYASIAVYDVDKRVKLTESFDVTCSSAEELGMLGPLYAGDAVTKARKAIFGLPYKSKDLYLIAHVSKILKGDDSDKVVEPYMKGAGLKPKERAKLVAEAKEMGPKLGKHRQVIAWGARRMFSNNDDCLLGADSRIDLYRVKFDTLKQGPYQLPKDIEDKRHRAIPGGRIEMAVEVLVPPTYPAGRLDPMLTPLLPQAKGASKDVIREMQVFQPDDTTVPAASYTNLAFVWPDFADFSNHSLPGVSNIRNIAVEVTLKMDDDDAKAPGLPCMLGTSTQSMVTTAATSSVTYHKQKPRFCDEFVARIPANAAPGKVHLLFKFMQVGCDPKKARKGAAAESVVGYVPFTLFQEDDTLRDSGPYSHPILCPDEHGSLPKGYLDILDNALNGNQDDGDGGSGGVGDSAGGSGVASEESDDEGGLRRSQSSKRGSPSSATTTPIVAKRGMTTLRRSTLRGSKDVIPALDDESGMRYVDRGRARFDFRVLFESAVLTQDFLLQRFFARYAAWLAKPETPMVKSINRLNRVRPSVLVRHFPVVAHELVTLMCHGDSSVDLQTEAFLTLCQCVDVLWKESGEGVAEAYTTYMFGATKDGAEEFPAENFYRRAIRLLISTLRSDDQRGEAAYRIAPLLFNMLFKSMCIDAKARGVMSKPAEQRFPFTPFPDELKYLYSLLRHKVVALSEVSFTVAKTLNVGIALFTRDLLDVMHHGLVGELFLDYITRLDPGVTSISLQIFKQTNIRIVSDHAKFVDINNPKVSKITSVATVSTEWWSKHFFVSVIIREIEATMVTLITSRGKPGNHDDTMTQGLVVALDAFAGLLRSHDLDKRYMEKDESKQAVSQLYFPYVLLVCDLIGHINKYGREEQRLTFASWLWILKHVGRPFLTAWWNREAPKRQLALLAGLRLAIRAFTPAERQKGTSQPPSAAMGGKVRSFAAKKDSSLSDMRAIEATYGAGGAGPSASGEHSSYRNFMKERGVSLKRNSSKKGPEDGNSFLPKASTSETKEYIESLYDKQGGVGGGVMRKGGYRAWANAGKRSSVGMDALTSLRGRKHSGKRGGVGSSSRGTVSRTGGATALLHELPASLEASMIALDVLVAFMEDFQSDLKSPKSQFAKRSFSALRDMLKQDAPSLFAVPLFSAIEKLMKRYRAQLFRYPNSSCSKLVRELLPYLAADDRIVRARATALIAAFVAENMAEMGNISRMKLQMTIGVSELVQGGDDFRYLRSSLMALIPAAQKSSAKLGTEMEGLVERLFSVLTDSARIMHYRWDLETTADLYYQISKGYIDSPDLRVTWILQLAQLHKSKDNWEEAVHANIVAAALVARYLLLLKRVPDTTPSDFTSVYPSVEAELDMPDLSALESLKKDICRSQHFSEGGFIELLLEAVNILKKHKMYEMAIEVYKILLPVYEERGDYSKQGKVHADLQGLCELAAQEEKAAERIFSNSYRVNFFGEQFEHLDGGEYIYREPASVRIAEFTQNIVMQYGLRLGLRDGIPLLPNGRRVKPGELDPKEPQMQIVSVEPFFEGAEDKDRSTAFQRNHNIQSFVFETPFYPEGAEKNMENQHIRRTILRTETAFPSLRKRLKVVNKEERVLTPIEVGIGAIEGKCEALHKELVSLHPDTKALQLVLQGSLLLQVNAGPLAVFQTFLGEDAPKGAKVEHISQLRDAMARFLDLLSQGVVLNKGLIGPQQADLQEMLEEGLGKFRAQVVPLSAGGIAPEEDL